MATYNVQQQILELYVGWFNRVPDSTGINYWITQYDNGTSLNTISQKFYEAATTQYSADTGYTTGMSTDALITKLYEGVFGRSGSLAPNAQEIAYWAAKLTALGGDKGALVTQMVSEFKAFDTSDMPELKAKQDTFTHKVQVAEVLALQNTYTGDIAAGKAALAGVTADAASVTTAINGDAAATAGKTFTLTSSVDTGAAFTGTSKNDTYNATDATFTGLDSIDGGAGNDTLNINDVTGNGVFGSTATVTNIETVNVRSTTGVTVDSTTWTGVTALNVTQAGTADVDLTAANTTNITTTGVKSDLTIDGGKDISVTAGTGSTSIAIGHTTASTGTITVTDTAQATNDIDIDGGTNVTLTTSGVTEGAITVGDTTAPTGAVSVSSTGTAYTASTADSVLGAIAVTGGTTVSVTQVAASSTTAAATDTDNNTITQSAVTVIGTSATTAVTVTQDAAIGVVDYQAATADTDAVEGVMGVNNGAVTIADANAGSATAAGTIAEVTLNNFGDATINSSALTTVNLSGTGTSLGVSRGALTATPTPTANTLALNVEGLTTTGAITDSEAAAADDGFTTIDITATGDDTTIASLVAADATTLTISGDATVTLTGLTAAALTSVTVEDGGVTIDSTLATGASFTSGSGNDAIKVAATTKAIATGAGDDTVTMASGTTTITGSIDAGDGTDTLVMDAANAVTATVDATAKAAFADKISNFEKLSLGGVAATGEVKLNNLDNINDISVAGVSASQVLTLSGATTGVNVRFADATQTATTVTLATPAGTADVANIFTTSADDNGITLAALTLTDFEIINFTTEDSTAETDVVSQTTVTTLTAAAAKTITVTGNGGLALTTATSATALTSFDASGVTAGTVSYTTGALAAAATLTGGDGNDILNAHSATQAVSIDGGEGDDTIDGSSATASTLNGDAGNDTITGGTGADTITGGEGDDSISGAAGNDSIDAGAGNDTIDASTGVDHIITGAGSDIVVYTLVADSTGANADTITDFTTGTDKLHFTVDGSADESGTTIDVSSFASVASFTDGVVSLSGTSTNTGEVRGDGFYSTADGKLYIDANGDGQINQNNDYTVVVDDVAAGDLAFSLVGGAGADTITASAGDDTIEGGAGADTITSGGGNDTITDYGVSAGVDVLKFGAAVTIAAATGTVNYTTAADNALSYASNATTGFVTFNEVDGFNAMTDTSQWTLADKIAAVKADATLNVAGKVSMFSDGENAYVYYAGATTGSTDNQLMTITGGSTLGQIETHDSGANFTLSASTAPASITFTTTLASYTGLSPSTQGDNSFSVLAGADSQGQVWATWTALGDDFVPIGWAGLGAATITAAGGDTTLTGYLAANSGNRTFSTNYANAFNSNNGNGTLNESAATANMLLAPDAWTVFYAQNSAYSITGGTGNDMIFGTGAGDTLTGGAGNDLIVGGDGADTIVMATNLTTGDYILGGAGTDTLTFTDDLSGTTDLDHVTTVETITLGGAVTSVTTVDALVASAATLTVDGALATTLTWSGAAETDGKFSITGGAGADTITGGDGADTITGGAGADSMTGGDGADTFVFAASDSGVISGTVFDIVTDYVVNTGGDTLDLAGTPTVTADVTGTDVSAADTEAGGGTITADITDGVIDVGGGDAADITTLVEWLAIARIMADADTEVVAFEFSGDTYVYQENTGGDLLVQLDSVTGVVAVGTVAAANTILIA